MMKSILYFNTISVCVLHITLVNPIFGQITFDCTNSPACAPLIIKDAPVYLLPDSTLSVTRGMADADIAFESDSNFLYLTYTFITQNVTSTSNPVIFKKDPSVSIQLAKSTDYGLTWNYVKTLKQSSSEINPTTLQEGFSGYEVSSIVKGNSLWYFAYLRFHDPVGGGNNRLNSSFYIGLTKSASILGLDSKSEVKLSGNFADSVWLDYNLSTMATECKECDIWLDPELFYQDGNLYLLATCEPYNNGVRISDATFYGVFKISTDEVSFGKPSWIGKIAVANDAKVFGGDELSKADLVYAADSSLFLITAPVYKGSLFEEYPGAYVFSASFGQNPVIYRDSNNTPLVFAIITSSDSEPTSGSAAYHSVSNTGIIVTRREMYPSQQRLEWSLHQTGIHPKSALSVIQDSNINPDLVKIYPSPNNSTLFIEKGNNNLLQYQITNAIGQVMQKGNVSRNSIDVTKLQKGIYFIQLKDEKEGVFATKFIKE